MISYKVNISIAAGEVYMKSKPRIVIIGAGSTSFGLSMIRDAFAQKELWGSELVFVDIDEEALKLIVKAAERMNDELNAGFKIAMTTNRKTAFTDAKYVIVAFAVNRYEMWRNDFIIPKKYGVNHVLGENGGPGCVFHTMRNIPIVLDICKDIERLCPNALVINFTNPESRICLAIKKYTSVKVVGLCHQVMEGMKIISKILDKNMDSFNVRAYGINHFTWIKDIRDNETNKDLYSLFKEKEKNYDKNFETLSRFMFNKFGMFPASGDRHLGEYIAYAHEMVDTCGYDFNHAKQRKEDLKNYIMGIGSGRLKITDEFLFPGHGPISMLKPSGEKAFEIIKAIEYDINENLISANIPNDGYITNLSQDSIVEVPAIVNSTGVKGIKMGDLPRGIAAMCMNQINIQHLVVDAGATGKKDMIQQALLIDPCINSAKAAMGIYSELMKINKDYYTQFF
jgi:alpha-galactosidase